METEIKLEKTKFTILNYIAEELWKDNIALNEPDLQITQYISHMMSKEIVIRLSCKFLTRDEGEYEFEWYKSWWQELREKMLPRWWIKQYPSKMEIKKKIKCIATYPSIRINDTEHKSYIDFIQK